VLLDETARAAQAALKTLTDEERHYLEVEAQLADLESEPVESEPIVQESALEPSPVSPTTAPVVVPAPIVSPTLAAIAATDLPLLYHDAKRAVLVAFERDYFTRVMVRRAALKRYGSTNAPSSGTLPLIAEGKSRAEALPRVVEKEGHARRWLRRSATSRRRRERPRRSATSHRGSSTPHWDLSEKSLPGSRGKGHSSEALWSSAESASAA
jgi:hypothetical protein